MANVIKTRVQAILFVLLGIVASGVRAQETSLQPSLAGPLNAAQWTLDGSGAWHIADGRLVLSKPGVPGGSIRRPAALAILQGDDFRQASVRAQVRSTAPVELVRRDLEVVVGYQSPSRFYYVHLAGITDPVHNGIFLVADADRRRLDGGTGAPQLKDGAWHDVRVEWNASTGRIEVYVDSAPTPALQATDTTISHGRVGFGSFDDTGEFRQIRVTGARR